MFEFDAGKLLIIGIVALVVIGPKELPRVLRQVGQAVAKLRRMAAEFQGQFMEAMREAELSEIKEEAAKLAASAKVDIGINPIAELENELTAAIDGTSRKAPSPADGAASGHTAVSPVSSETDDKILGTDEARDNGPSGSESEPEQQVVLGATPEPAPAIDRASPVS